MGRTATPLLAVAFLLGTAVALFASNVLIVRIERVGARLGLTEAALGLLAAAAADSPEITSAFTALALGRRDIGVGVVLGANVLNLTLLLGLSAVAARRIALDRRVVVLEGVVATWIALASVSAATGWVPPWAGLLLAALAFVPYVVVSVLPERARRRLPFTRAGSQALAETLAEEESELRVAIAPRAGTATDAWLAAMMLLVVIGSAVVMADSAAEIGRRLGIPDAVLGGVLLAAVTTLPNVVAAIHLARRGRGAATLSEALNSNAINSTVGFLVPAAIIGLGALGAAAGVALWYVGATLVVSGLTWAARGIDRRLGYLLVAGYAVFVLTVVLGS